MAGSICVRLPQELIRGLDEIADSSERTKSYLIRKAVEQYLDEYADYRIALDRLHNKDDDIISSKELRRRLASKH